MRHLAALSVAGVLLAACAGPRGGETLQEAVEGAAAAEIAPEARTVAQQIDAMEQAWAGALRRKDRAELERLLAPEFRLEGAALAPSADRAAWLANLERMEVRNYAVRVTDVKVAGDTAVASVEGEWTVSMAGGPMRNERFELQDTWVRRGGAWVATRRVRLR